MKLLNVACGNRFHKDWVNIDFQAISHEVSAMNILNGLPFKDNSFDAVYSSHFLEHLTKPQADFVLSEIFRVLKPDGVVRIVVPDLENICREYLNVLSDIQNNLNKKRYEWIVVELLDQMARTEAGGEMLKIYKDDTTVNDEFLRDYIYKRVGTKINVPDKGSVGSLIKSTAGSINFQKVKKILFYAYISSLKGLFPRSVKDSLIINTTVGEKHLWMYDAYSLSEKLKKNAFINIRFFAHNESQIPQFADYCLDTNKDGTPYKGISSVYCEGIKP
jgi:predicted SAM-dependent methyltransferase